MLRVVTFKWERRDYRTKYTADHVNTLFRMVARHYHDDWEPVCVTDDPEGLDPHIRHVPLWDDHLHMKPPQGYKNPSCFVRLKLFSEEMADIIGPRFVALDLDVMAVDDITPLWNREEEFMMYGGTHPSTPYNGSMLLMTAGARKQVWENFHPDRTPAAAKAAGYFGSDQASISYLLGPKERIWTRIDGVHSYRNHIRPVRGKVLPDGARMVMFHGRIDPWHQEAQSLDWVKEHYR